MKRDYRTIGLRALEKYIGRTVFLHYDAQPDITRRSERREFILDMNDEGTLVLTGWKNIPAREIIEGDHIEIPKDLPKERILNSGIPCTDSYIVDEEYG